MSARARVALASVVIALICGLAGSTASAIPGSTGTGYTVEVTVTYSGEAAPGGGGSRSVSLPVECYWVSVGVTQLGAVDSSDPEAVYEYYRTVMVRYLQGHAATGRLSLPSDAMFREAIRLAASGEQVTWYAARCEDPDDYLRLGFNAGVNTYAGNQYPITWQYFTPGDPVPPPAVDPEELARSARDVMVIDEPVVDRNPKAVGGLSGATFVNLPTWFWVTNPEAVGGADAARSIRAEVQGSGVWAEVTARTDGLSLSSPAGSTQCDPASAMTSWSPGGDDANACSVAFQRASVFFPVGFPVTASTDWSATWVGQDQGGASVGGALEPLSRSATAAVPVGEVQAVVSGVR
ncbi:MAG TPA: hypothetical protein VIQ02_02760 [Jiangellaceae bacterium]